MPLLTTRAGASARAFGFSAPSGESMVLLGTFAPSTPTASYTLTFNDTTYRSFLIVGYAELHYTGNTYDGFSNSAYIVPRNSAGTTLGAYPCEITTGRQSTAMGVQANYAIPLEVPQYNYSYNRPATFRALITSANTTSPKPYSYERSDYNQGFGYFIRTSGTGLINSNDRIGQLHFSEGSGNGFRPSTKVFFYGIKA